MPLWRRPVSSASEAGDPAGSGLARYVGIDLHGLAPCDSALCLSGMQHPGTYGYPSICMQRSRCHLRCRHRLNRGFSIYLTSNPSRLVSVICHPCSVEVVVPKSYTSALWRKRPLSLNRYIGSNLKYIRNQERMVSPESVQLCFSSVLCTVRPLATPRVRQCREAICSDATVRT